MKTLTLALIAILTASTLASAIPSSHAKNQPLRFVAVLSGPNEVPARDTLARGLAVIQVSPDGTQVTFRLIAANINNVIMAHIHIAPEGTNGPVVVFFYGPVPPGGGRFDGVLSVGTRTASDLVGPLQGHPFSDLVTAISSGNAYVNVHTDDGVPPANTGAGDFPGGEIRGQLMPAN